MNRIILLLASAFLLIGSCKKGADDDILTDPVMVKFSFSFAPDQERLDGFGQVATIPTGNAALTPDFSSMSAHFIELVPAAFTPYKSGAFIYKGKEVSANNPNPYGFTTAIDFDNAIVAGEGESFLEIPLKDITPGTYEHIRISVSYQNYKTKYNLINIPVIGALHNETGTIASFVGYNSHINTLEIFNEEVVVNDTKLQGFWAFETQFSGQYESYNQVFTGQAPESATTVVNPFPNAPIPQGSCVVSGSFDQPFTITGDEKEDINITLSFSINNSFEWKDFNGNGEWDLDAQKPDNSEPVVDMGLRGLKAFSDL